MKFHHFLIPLSKPVPIWLQQRRPALVIVAVLALIFVFTPPVAYAAKFPEPYLSWDKAAIKRYQFEGCGTVELRAMEPDVPLVGTAWFVPGWPSLWPSAVPPLEFLRKRGYRCVIITLVGHSRQPTEDSWHFGIEQYARILRKVLEVEMRAAKTLANDEPAKLVILAESAGGELTWRALLDAAENDVRLPVTDLCLLNGWLPSLTNAAIPWGHLEEATRTYWAWMIRYFGFLSEGEALDALFVDRKRNTEFVKSQKKVSGGWPMATFFVDLMQGTTREQKRILDLGEAYELPPSRLLTFKHAVGGIRVLAIESAGTNDHIIARAWKNSFRHAVISKLPELQFEIAEIENGGHLIHVERTKDVATRLAQFLQIPGPDDPIPSIHANVVELPNGDFRPRSGYAWITDAPNDFRVVWVSGTQHESYLNITSDERESWWRAAPGYSFVASNSLVVAWSPGRKHPVIPNIHAAERETYWQADPGYSFTEPTRTLTVRWVPGALHPTNTNLVAGLQEGAWSKRNGPQD